MRCLYCGEPLSLLRKLTGKAEFCSDAHREAYQEEFNSLALQRLAAHPKVGRRPESSMPPATSSPADSPAATFAGLPYPPDTQDTDEAFELPVFDSPIFASAATSVSADAAHAPVVSSVTPASPVPSFAAEAPAPLWVLLSNPRPSPGGEAPATYSFPTALADYPRPCLIEPGAFSSLARPQAPFAGYVDLPEPLDQPSTGVPLPDPALAPTCTVPARVLPDFAWAPLSCGDLTEEDQLLSLAIATCRPPLAGITLSESVPVALSSSAPLCPALQGHSPVEPGVAPLFELSFAADDWRSAGSAAGVPEPLPVPALCESFDAERRPLRPVLGEMTSETTLPSACCAPLIGAVASAPLGASASAQADSIEHLETGSEFHQLWTVPLLRSAPRRTLPPAGPLGPTLASFASPASERSLLSASLPWPTTLPALPMALAAAAAGESTADAGIAALPFLADRFESMSPPPAQLAPSPALDRNQPFSGDWMNFDPSEELAIPATPPSTGTLALGQAGFEPLAVDLYGTRTSSPFSPFPVAPVRCSLDVPHPELRVPPSMLPTKTSALAKVRVSDFGWPDFAAGCESLFTPDQPFRFHEMPFPQRGTSELLAGSVLHGEILGGLRLSFADDRFASVLRPPSAPDGVETWLAESASVPSQWANPRSPSIPPALSSPPKARPAESSPISASVPAPAFGMPNSVPQPRVAAPAPPPASWQQAARAMYEGEQQHVPRDVPPPAPAAAPPAAKAPAPAAAPPAKPTETARSVNAVPVTDPVRGTEVARVAPATPPAPFVRQSPMPAGDTHQPSANEQPQFEWRRDQPNQPPPHGQPHGGSSTISLNTTITVEGNTGGIVVESAVRISMGDRANSSKKKSDAVERFSEGQDLGDSRIHLAAPEGLPEFVAEPAELRAILQPVVPPADSIQWPKFSVTPMRRRVAFGPARGGLFGSPSPAAPPKPPSEAKTLPPKKSVGGFLFKKLTNS